MHTFTVLESKPVSQERWCTGRGDITNPSHSNTMCAVSLCPERSSVCDSPKSHACSRSGLVHERFTSQGQNKHQMLNTLEYIQPQERPFMNELRGTKHSRIKQNQHVLVQTKADGKSSALVIHYLRLV